MVHEILFCDAAAEFCIEKVEYETKKNTVVVHGKFDAEKLCSRVRYKAGKCIKDCQSKPAEKPKPVVCCKPKPDDCCKCKLDDCCCKPKPDDCCCKPKPKPAEEPKPPPKPEYKLVPYPMSCPSWPWQCPPQQQCQTCTPPPPPPQTLCKCSQQHSSPSTKPCDDTCKLPTLTCSCGRMPPSIWPPQPVAWAPPPWAASELVTQESACSVM